MDTLIVDIKWTTDTRASNHMTAHSGMLKNLKKYVSRDSFFIGDGPPLKIDVVENILVYDGKNELFLHDILHVPQLTQNLLSIS